MKTNFIAGASKAGVAALKADPAIIRLRTLRNRVRDGTASNQEQSEYDKMMKPAREMKSGVLVD